MVRGRETPLQSCLHFRSDLTNKSSSFLTPSNPPCMVPTLTESNWLNGWYPPPSGQNSFVLRATRGSCALHPFCSSLTANLNLFTWICLCVTIRRENTTFSFNLMCFWRNKTNKKNTSRYSYPGEINVICSSCYRVAKPIVVSINVIMVLFLPWM